MVKRVCDRTRTILNACGFQEITTKWDLDKNIFVTEQFFVEKDVIQNKKKEKNF